MRRRARSLVLVAAVGLLAARSAWVLPAWAAGIGVLWLVWPR